MASAPCCSRPALDADRARARGADRRPDRHAHEPDPRIHPPRRDHLGGSLGRRVRGSGSPRPPAPPRASPRLRPLNLLRIPTRPRAHADRRAHHDQQRLRDRGVHRGGPAPHGRARFACSPRGRPRGHRPRFRRRRQRIPTRLQRRAPRRRERPTAPQLIDRLTAQLGAQREEATLEALRIRARTDLGAASRLVASLAAPTGPSPSEVVAWLGEHDLEKSAALVSAYIFTPTIALTEFAADLATSMDTELGARRIRTAKPPQAPAPHFATTRRSGPTSSRPPAPASANIL
jgi:hypothetical protein